MIVSTISTIVFRVVDSLRIKNRCSILINGDIKCDSKELHKIAHDTVTSSPNESKNIDAIVCESSKSFDAVLMFLGLGYRFFLTSLIEFLYRITIAFVRDRDALRMDITTVSVVVSVG